MLPCEATKEELVISNKLETDCKTNSVISVQPCALAVRMWSVKLRNYLFTFINNLFCLCTGSPTSAESVTSGYSGSATERNSPGPAPGSPVASIKFGQRATRTSPLYGSLKKVIVHPAAFTHLSKAVWSYFFDHNLKF